MPLAGELPVYDYDFEDWLKFTERLDAYYNLNDIRDMDKKHALLRLAVDDHTYESIQNLSYPKQPSELNFTDIFDMINRQFISISAKPVFKLRYDFYVAKQDRKESILEWYDRIKYLSLDCGFGNDFSSVIFDRFISGITSMPIQQKLMEQFGVLTVRQVIDLAVLFEKNLTIYLTENV